MPDSDSSIADTPKASTAHIAYTDGPPSMSTTCMVGPAGERVRRPDRTALPQADHVILVQRGQHPVQISTASRPNEGEPVRRRPGGGERCSTDARVPPVRPG
jgi:hypothetical protein